MQTNYFVDMEEYLTQKHEYQLLKKPQSGKFEKKLKDKYRNYYFDNEVDHFLYLYDYSKMDADVIFNKKYTFDFKVYLE